MNAAVKYCQGSQEWVGAIRIDMEASMPHVDHVRAEGVNASTQTLIHIRFSHSACRMDAFGVTCSFSC